MNKSLVVLLCSSWLLAPCSRLLRAGDAVAVAYNADGIWTDVTYYRSATSKSGKDYRTSAQARELALRDVRRRSKFPVATAQIVSFSDRTGFVTVVHGQNQSGRDFHAVGRGTTQAEADRNALERLNGAGATSEQRIVYQYFSYGAESK